MQPPIPDTSPPSAVTTTAWVEDHADQPQRLMVAGAVVVMGRGAPYTLPCHLLHETFIIPERRRRGIPGML